MQAAKIDFYDLIELLQSTLVCGAGPVIIVEGQGKPYPPGTGIRTSGISSLGGRSILSQSNSLESISLESIGKINMDLNSFGPERFSDMSEVIFKRSIEKNINMQPDYSLNC